MSSLLAGSDRVPAHRGRPKGAVLNPAGTDNVTGARVTIGNTPQPSVSHTPPRKYPRIWLPFVLKCTPECRSRLFYLAVAHGSFSCFALLRRHLSLSLSLTRHTTATTIALPLARSSANVVTQVTWSRRYCIKTI